MSDRTSRVVRDVLKQAELRRRMQIPARSEEERRRLMIWRLMGEPADTAYIFFFDKKFRCRKTVCACRCGIRLWDSYADMIVRQTEEMGTVYFSAAHNHVDEPLIPSPDDLRLTYVMKQDVCERLWGEGAFLGHYITDGFASVKIMI